MENYVANPELSGIAVPRVIQRDKKFYKVVVSCSLLSFEARKCVKDVKVAFFLLMRSQPLYRLYRS